MIEEVCNFLEVWNKRTTPFHPQSDGVSERSIRTVNNMLAKVVADDQRNWDLYVSSSCFAHNTAVHSINRIDAKLFTVWEGALVAERPCGAR